MHDHMDEEEVRSVGRNCVKEGSVDFMDAIHPSLGNAIVQGG